jgi:hypothetical protein
MKIALGDVRERGEATGEKGRVGQRGRSEKGNNRGERVFIP